MNLESLFNNDKKRDISGAFDICTSVGDVDGTTKYDAHFSKEEFSASFDNGNFKVLSIIDKKRNTFVRQDTITNISNEPIYLKKYLYRFTLSADDVLVYTQQNSWTNESNGVWQKLVSCISVENYGIRTNNNATPFLSVWDNSCDRGLAFNLVPSVAWKMICSRKTASVLDNFVVIEMGINDDRLNLEIKPNETIELPEIIFYDYDNKIDMGSTKLHDYMNEFYPMKHLPVIYNTWFANFDGLSYDFCLEQAKRAAYIGCEYFVVDAGWFGSDDGWYKHIGEWTENLSGAFCGQMKELADNVRSLGMKFGLWVEAERALEFAPSVKKNPEYYLKEGDYYFLDYANKEATAYIEKVVCDLVDQYGIEFIKFDFNADCGYDGRNSAFYHYHRGHKEFIDNIHNKYPGIYLENCASGGFRLDLFHAKFMDGIWFSDNQNTAEDTRILRDTILRMPPAIIERWTAIKSVDGFPSIYSNDGKTTSRLVGVDRATWVKLSGIDMQYVRDFCTGGPLGITSNLSELNKTHLEELKTIISEYKNIRDFYKNAVCKILIATDSCTILQYTDVDEKMVVIEYFENRLRQDTITIYPRLDKGKNYEGYTSKELKENGIEIKRVHTADQSQASGSFILKCI